MEVPDGDGSASVEEVETVPVEGRELGDSFGDLDCATSSFAPIIVMEWPDGDGSTSVEEVETVPVEGRELGDSFGDLVSGLDSGATTLEPRARLRRSRFSTAWSGVKRAVRLCFVCWRAEADNVPENLGLWSKSPASDRRRSPATIWWHHL